MNTANIPMYGNIGVYINIVLSVYAIHYTLRCLEDICSVSSSLRRLILLIVKTLTNVL